MIDFAVLLELPEGVISGLCVSLSWTDPSKVGAVVGLSDVLDDVFDIFSFTEDELPSTVVAVAVCDLSICPDSSSHFAEKLHAICS